MNYLLYDLIACLKHFIKYSTLPRDSIKLYLGIVKFTSIHLAVLDLVMIPLLTLWSFLKMQFVHACLRQGRLGAKENS